MRHILPYRLVLLLSASASLILAGCMTTTGLNAPISQQATFCATAKPIYWSDKDSDGTIWEAKEHNRIGKELCGWGKK
jgi:outer membrane biogenesis lipoprotein LolB